MQPADLLGTTLEGRYRVDELIARDDRRLLFRGEHLRAEMPVAIEVFTLPAEDTPEAQATTLERFRDTWRTLMRLQHPALPHLHDFGTIGGSPDTPYVVRAWIEGQPLHRTLTVMRDAKVRMPAEAALGLLLPVVEALALAHQHRITHGDVDPKNLLVSSTESRPTLRLLGLGVASAFGPEAARERNQGEPPWGTYAAPEQISPRRYGDVGPWTDVHALGLLLIELLTARPALDGEELFELVEATTRTERPSARARGAAISDELESVLGRAVALASADRPPDAAALAAQLRDILSNNREPSPGDLGATDLFGIGASSTPTDREEVVRGNPKGSFYDDGLQEPGPTAPPPDPPPPRRLPVLAGLALVAIVAALTVLARRWGLW